MFDRTFRPSSVVSVTSKAGDLWQAFSTKPPSGDAAAPLRGTPRWHTRVDQRPRGGDETRASAAQPSGIPSTHDSPARRAGGAGDAAGAELRRPASHAQKSSSVIADRQPTRPVVGQGDGPTAGRHAKVPRRSGDIRRRKLMFSVNLIQVWAGTGGWRLQYGPAAGGLPVGSAVAWPGSGSGLGDAAATKPPR